MPRLKKLPELEKWINQLKFYVFEVKGEIASIHVIINSKNAEYAKNRLSKKYVDKEIIYVGIISDSIIEI